MGRRIEGERCVQEIEYSPLPSQRKFHELDVKFKGFSGPIGSGKSQALCHEALRLSYINAGRTGLLGAPTYPMLRDSTQQALLEVLEENGIPYELNRSDNVLTLGDTRSRILFRSLEEYERLRGTNLAWFGVDELTYTHEESWLRLEGRLRDPKAVQLRGYAVWTPKGFDWVYRRFVKDAGEDYQVVFAKPAENKHVLRAAPDFYERLRRTYDDVFFRQEVLGEYLEPGTDRVYRNFSRERNLEGVSIRPNLPLLWALDFNVDPLCSVVAQIVNGVVLVADEIVLRRATTKEACEEFWNRHGRHTGPLIIYGDASGSRAQTAGSSDYRIIQEYLSRAGRRDAEIRTLRGNPPVRDRVQLVNAKLLNAAKEIEIRIAPQCRKLVQDLEEVQYKAGSTVVEKDRRPELTHLSDALGYLIWYEFGHQPRAGEQGRRLL
ncbi:MAG: hypothetical protein HYZ37_10170 [Candidatus Solibacter usitatus]|nr:hypothetical protein [Candidatus Solibacter usitatus]